MADLPRSDETDQHIVSVVKCIRQLLKHSDTYLFWRSQFEDLLN